MLMSFTLMVMNLINNLDQPHKNILYFKYIKSLTGFEDTHFHNSLVDCRAILYIIDYLNATQEVAL